MAPPPAVQKTCCLCRQDVSSQQRIKDAQGSYYCAPCWAKTHAPTTLVTPAAPAVANDDEDIPLADATPVPAPRAVPHPPSAGVIERRPTAVVDSPDRQAAANTAALLAKTNFVMAVVGPVLVGVALLHMGAEFSLLVMIGAAVVMAFYVVCGTVLGVLSTCIATGGKVSPIVALALTCAFFPLNAFFVVDGLLTAARGEQLTPALATAALSLLMMALSGKLGFHAIRTVAGK